MHGTRELGLRGRFERRRTERELPGPGEQLTCPRLADVPRDTAPIVRVGARARAADRRHALDPGVCFRMHDACERPRREAWDDALGDAWG